jgi:AraC-like DNA-binding protein
MSAKWFDFQHPQDCLWQDMILPDPFDLIVCDCREFSAPDDLSFDELDGYHVGIVDSGRLEFIIRGAVKVAETGDLWALSARRSPIGVAADSTARGIHITLKGKDAPNIIDRWGIHRSRISTPARYAHRTSLLLQQLCHHFQKPSGRNPYYLLTRLLRVAEYQFEIVTESSADRAEQIVALTKETWEHDPSVSVARIAHRLRISATTLRKSCHRITGMGPHDYLNRLRQDRAKEMLFKTENKIGHIARATGFPNEKYFMTWFKKLEGLTPGQWRRRIHTRREDAGGRR